MTHKKLKQTEIGEIPEDWNTDRISNLPFEIGDGNYSSKYPKTSELLDAGVPFISGKDLSNGRIRSQGLRYISNEQHSRLLKGHIQSRDVLLVTRADIGVVGYVTEEYEDANINAQLVFLRADNEVINSEYLYYLLSAPQYKRLLIRYSSGSAQSQLPIKVLNKIPIIFPDIGEQQQIASVLSSLDDKIELNRKMNKTLEEIGKALFDQLNEVEDSSAIELTEIVDFNPRESLSKSTEARYLEMKDLPEQGMWIASNIKKPYKGGSKFRNGDILMARITPCLENGKSGFVNSLDDGELAFGSTEFIVLRPKKRMFAEYIYYLVRNELFRRHAIRSMVGSSGRQRVQVDVLKSYKLSFPKDDKLEEFNKSANTLFEQIKQNSVEIELLSQIRDKLLPRLMSGKIRVTV